MSYSRNQQNCYNTYFILHVLYLHNILGLHMKVEWEVHVTRAAGELSKESTQQGATQNTLKGEKGL